MYSNINEINNDGGIVKNFFTAIEEKQLRDLVEVNRKLKPGSSKYAPMILETMSRMQIQFDIPESILNKLLAFVKSFVSEEDQDLVLSHYQYLDYYGKYGNGNSPKLPPHLDVENYYTKISVDYQMSSNIDWAIVVEDKKYYLKDNEVLVFEPGEQIHWRDPIILKENDRCEVIVFHFSKREDHSPYENQQMSKKEWSAILDKYNNMPKMIKYREKFFDDLQKLERNG